MNWNLIHKFLSDQCTDAERTQVERWLDENDDHRTFLNTIQKIWEVKPKKEGEINVKAAWNEFRNKRMSSPSVNNAKEIAGSGSQYYRSATTKWYQRKSFYAAAAVILLMATVLFVANNQLTSQEEITYQEIITANGEKTNVKLSDGTHVMLNAKTSIKIPSNYGKEDRTLYMEGEAFFEVEHNKEKPFRVYAKDVLTEDLGTKFNINTYAGNGRVEVVVAEGEVVMKNTSGPDNDKTPVHLKAHERGVNSGGEFFEKSTISNLVSYIGWTQRKLVFEDTPLSEVVKALERWYGVECIIKDNELRDQRLTATFSNEALSNVLKLINRSMDIVVTDRKKKVFFSKK